MTKNIFTGLFLILLFCAGCQKEEIGPEYHESKADFKVELSREQLNERISAIVREKQGISWNDLTDQELVSAHRMAQVNIVTIAWSRDPGSANDHEVILKKLQELEPSKAEGEDRQVIEVNINLNTMDVRVNDAETLIALRHLPEVESIDVYYNILTSEQMEAANREIQLRQQELESNSATIDRNGPSTKNPDVGVYHNIDDAWASDALSAYGQGIKVGVIDVGINPSDDVVGVGKNSVVSQSNKLGRWKLCPWCWWDDYDGPYSQPGMISSGLIFLNHGVGRLEEIGFPYNPQGLTGVAYNAECISMRGTNIVSIDVSENIYPNIKGIQRSYEYFAGTNVKIVAAANGALWEWASIRNAVQDCKNSPNGEKLIFSAAGTFPAGILIEAALEESVGQLTLFPARMPETEACTAINMVGNIPTYALFAFGNADFVSRFNFPLGTSSEATGYNAGIAAVIWSTNPSMSASQVRDKMRLAATSPSHNYFTFGFGMVDMLQFIENESTSSLVSLRGNNGRYVSSENGTTGMRCNRTNVYSQEKFTIVNAGGGKVALQGSNGRYVSSENGNANMRCNRTSIGSWEKFTKIDLGNNKFALKGSNNRYVSSNNGTSPMRCNRTSIGSWEKFTISPVN